MITIRIAQILAIFFIFFVIATNVPSIQGPFDSVMSDLLLLAIVLIPLMIAAVTLGPYREPGRNFDKLLIRSKSYLASILVCAVIATIIKQGLRGNPDGVVAFMLVQIVLPTFVLTLWLILHFVLRQFTQAKPT